MYNETSDFTLLIGENINITMEERHFALSPKFVVQ
jgi:hypothetical protein